MLKTAFKLLLILCMDKGGHAENLVPRESDITVDKQAQAVLLNNQLAELDKLYGNASALLKTLESQTLKQKKNQTKIQAEIQTLTMEISKQHNELAGQIKTMYAMGNKERIKLLLNQQNPILMSRMIAYYDYLNTKRVNKLKHSNDMLNRLESLKKQNEIETEQLKINFSQKEQEQNSVELLKKQRTQLLKYAAPDFLSNEQQINRLKDNEVVLKNLLANLQTSNSNLNSEIENTRLLRKKHLEEEEEIVMASPTLLDEEPLVRTSHKTKEESLESLALNDHFPQLNGDFTKLKGQLPWPVKGLLLQKFGSVQEEGKLDGVIITTDEGTEIHAITDGKVVYADWMRGYGLIIIVDHGKGFISLYAFNQSLYKKVGDIVNSGDVIASVGLSGGHDKASLYFGIRKKGKAVNPVEWCK